MSFVKKLFLMSTLLITLPILVVFFIAANANHNMLISEYQRINTVAVSSVAKNMNELLRNLENTLLSIQYDKLVYHMFLSNEGTSESEYRYRMGADFETMEEYQHITGVLRNKAISGLPQALPMISLVTKNGVRFTNSPQEITHDDIGIAKSKLNDTDNLWLLHSKNPERWSASESGIASSTLGLVRKVKDPNNERIIGYTGITLEAQVVRMYFEEFIAENPLGCIYLVNNINSNYILCGTPGEAIDKILEEFPIQVAAQPNGSYLSKATSDKTLVIYNNLPINNWTVVFTVPVPAIFPSNTTFYSIMISTVFVVGLLSMMLAWGMGKSLSGNIMMLCNSMTEMKETEIPVHITIDSNDEIGKLADSYNTMIDRVVDGRSQLNNAQQQKLIAQRDFLQAQINTHFLYNTLNSIRVLGGMNRNKEIITITTSLIKFLRATIDNENDIITLNRELENVINYIFIQEIRYSGVFVVKYFISEDVGDYHIPKLLLQPIVENAIFHGMAGKESGGVIEIKICRLISNDVSIKISDNGRGRAELTPSYLSKGSRGSSKIGLQNIDERIKLYFGPAYGLTITDNQPCGLCVEVVIPKT